MANVFMRYMNKVWLAKTPMWCVGAQQIPHTRHNTNVAIKSYHCNLKNVLNTAKERFVSRRMDCLLYYLTVMFSIIIGTVSSAKNTDSYATRNKKVSPHRQ